MEIVVEIMVRLIVRELFLSFSFVDRDSVEGDTLEQILAYRLAWRSRLLAKLMAHPVLN